MWKNSVSYPKPFTDTWLVIPHGASNTTRGKTVMQGCVGCIVNDVTMFGSDFTIPPLKPYPSRARESQVREKNIRKKPYDVPGMPYGL